MSNLRDMLSSYVSDGSVPGAVALVARGDDIEVAAVGSIDVQGSVPMARDTIFRSASISKPITAAATMMLVDDGRIALDDPVSKWLPELQSPVVVRTPDGPVEDVVPAARPITVFDLLTFRAGYGFPADFSLSVVALLASDVQADGREPQRRRAPGEWMASLARIPLVYQPGQAWLYNTGSDLQGVLIARASGRTLPDFLAERIFEPLGMADSGFVVPAEKTDRFLPFYRIESDGGLGVADPMVGGQWSELPAFASGAGGMVGTIDDWFAFAQLLLAEGEFDGRRLLSAESVRKMTTNYLTAPQRAAATLFLEGQGWGFGGSVDVDVLDPWNVPGRYGWVGGTGTAAYLTPATGAVNILLTQVAMPGPTPTPIMRDFWRYAATA
ncbi:serine hydrolase [Fodinicola feengrottensis]|uniref:Serine hydrolase n=2 Tax=Fodinicola feengrottensis TaxID=435914 RepID=A0ABP4UB01_9ACTN